MRPLNTHPRLLPALLLLFLPSSLCHSADPSSTPDLLSSALRCVNSTSSSSPRPTPLSLRALEPLLLKPWRVGNFSWFHVRGDSVRPLHLEVVPNQRDVGEGALWLDEGRLGDAGIYAAVWEESGLLEECFNVTVYEPDPASCFLPEPVYEGRLAFIGQSHYFYCTELSKFLPPDGGGVSLTWLKDCSPLHRGQKVDKQLLIPKVSVDDEGNYSCIATFSRFNRTYTITRTRRVRVMVPSNEKPPTVLVPYKNTTVEVVMGQQLLVECVAFFGYEAVRAPIMYWVFNQTFIESKFNASEVWEHKTSVVNETHGEKFVSHHLEISHVSPNLLGVPFICFAQNGFGHGRGSVILVEKPLPPQTHTALVAGLLLSSFLLLLLLATVLYIRRIDLLLLYRDHCAAPAASDGMDYDAYVSFCTESPSPGEEEFALRTLPRILEEEFGYRLCLLDRDILPGGAVVEEIFSAIERSRRVLLVLSPAYAECAAHSARVRCELDAGLHATLSAGATRLLLVQFLPLPRPEALPNPGLRRALAVLPVIRCRPQDKSAPSSARFWKRLRYAMPALPRKGAAPAVSTTTNGSFRKAENNGGGGGDCRDVTLEMVSEAVVGDVAGNGLGRTGAFPTTTTTTTSTTANTTASTAIAATTTAAVAATTAAAVATTIATNTATITATATAMFPPKLCVSAAPEEMMHFLPAE